MKNLASFLLSVMLICFSACSNNDDLVEVRQQVTPLKNLARSIIRKTKCFDFWERNVLFPKTKRSFFRTPTLPFSA